MDTITLTNVFDSHKEALSEKLKGLSLPHDAQKVQEIVADFLNSLFESDGIYRQNLNQSEDYILQSALQLLQAQQNISAEVISSVKTANKVQSTSTNLNTKKGNEYAPVLGAGAGAIAGSLLGSWWAVCGAIAGTAIAIYCATKSSKATLNKENYDITTPIININVFTDIVKKVCESIDGLMLTYRVQVKRIENLYSQKEKPSLLQECSALFTQIANVYKAVESNKDNTPAKVVNATEMLIESLENYGLTMKDGKIVNE